jgi:hypothetical protein
MGTCILTTRGWHVFVLSNNAFTLWRNVIASISFRSEHTGVIIITVAIIHLYHHLEINTIIANHLYGYFKQLVMDYIRGNDKLKRVNLDHEIC